MGSSPEARFKSKARSVVDAAIASQADVTESLQKQAGQFIPDKFGGYGKVVKKIGGASGRTFPEYVGYAEDRLASTALPMIEQGREDLRSFQPNLLNSPSTANLTEYLTALGQDFSSGVKQIGEEGRDRFFRLPEQARIAFETSEQSPAFENIRNEQYMNLAKNPPTIQNDAMNMYRSLFTYNV